MARIIIQSAKTPYKLKIANETVLICRCGLTKLENGLCDDMCAKTHDEDDSKTYMYTDNGREQVDLIADEDDLGMCGCGSDSCGCNSGGCGCHSLDSLDDSADDKKAN